MGIPQNIEFTTFKGSKGGKIVQSTTTKDVSPKEVFVRVTHSGLCGTDVHYKGADMVLGHEGVGVVEAVGESVTLFKRGDRVGWGYVHNTCGHCKQCLRGTETYCPERQMYGFADLDQGSMAYSAVWNEDFLFKIPDDMPSEVAAPLQCGGATVFNALRYYDVKPTDRVGIIGVGGLGHLAIQFAAKMGCEVAVFSGTDSKKDEAMKLGAGEFYATKGVEKLENIKPLDHLLVTTSAQPKWELYLPVIGPTGTIYPLSVDEGNMSIPYMPLIVQGLRIQGSVVAARLIHRQMLEFAAYHGIKPMVETFPLTLQGVQDAFQKLEDGKMRYRGVLVAPHAE